MFNILNKYTVFDYNYEHYNPIRQRAVIDGGVMVPLGKGVMKVDFSIFSPNPLLLRPYEKNTGRPQTPGH